MDQKNKKQMESVEKIMDAQEAHFNKTMEIIIEYKKNEITAEEAMVKIIKATVLSGLQKVMGIFELKENEKE